MFMIPVTFLPASVLAVIAVWLATRLYQRLPAPWLIAFLCTLALQLFLLGARYGYGFDAVLNIQHFTGALIPPLAFLAFTNPSLSPRILLHAISVGSVGLVVVFAIYLADIALGLSTFAYAAGLAMAFWRDRDNTFAWAPLRYTSNLRLGLCATVATLVLSGLTDASIAADFLISGGLRTRTIAAAASFGGLGLLVACVAFLLRSRTDKQPATSLDADAKLVQKLSAMIVAKELFRDPDLTLSRLSKRLAFPARDLSQTVNRNTGLNMSQFINNMRISAVCDELASTDVSVTTAMLDAGFYTKSNFNREFRRVTGQTPTQWRSQNAS